MRYAVSAATSSTLAARLSPDAPRSQSWIFSSAAASETHAVADAIVELGYESMGEAEPGRIYFRRRQSGAYNVHVVEMGGTIWTDNLALRNYLRAHPREGDRYGIAKRQAAAAHSMLLA